MLANPFKVTLLGKGMAKLHLNKALNHQQAIGIQEKVQAVTFD
jgi:hypothetical protein